MPRWTKAGQQAQSEQMKAMWRDPKFRRRTIEASRARMKELWRDPEFRRRAIERNKAHLVDLTTKQRTDYDFLMRNGHKRPEAFKAIGREDLIA